MLKSTTKTSAMQHIVEYLEIHLKIKENPLIGEFLNLLEKGSRTERQFLYCIAIDIRHGLLEAETYIKTFNSFLYNLPVLDKEALTDFHYYIKTLPESNIFCNRFVLLKNIRYSRVVRKETYTKYISTNKLAYDNASLDFHPDIKNATKSWSGDKRIVWVTPYQDLHYFINAFDDAEQATKVCDFLGWKRDKDYFNSSSAKNGKLDNLIIINYPEYFPHNVMQPNSTNANWASPYPLFLSYCSIDGFGKTYNDYGEPFAQEGIHQEVAYWNDGFALLELGCPEPDNIESEKIFFEAEKRFKR